MPQKAQQSRQYRYVPKLLRELREGAQFTQRELGARLRKPQSWVYNCETANRRVDVTEFIAWSRACNVDPVDAFTQLLKK